MGDQPARIEMRCTILAISVAIMYASASPIVDDVVPEESYALDDDLSEAQQKIDDMTAAGKSDKDCRKLVTETRKEIQTNVDACQKTVNALPTGSSCPNEGQAAVKTATEAKSKADKQLTHTSTEVIKASTAKVTFESRSFSSLTEGKCDSFYSSSSYTTAKANYKAAVTAKTKAKGAAEEAAKAPAAEAKLRASARPGLTTRRPSLLTVLRTLLTRSPGTLHARWSVCSMARPTASAMLPPSAKSPS